MAKPIFTANSVLYFRGRVLDAVAKAARCDILFREGSPATIYSNGHLLLESLPKIVWQQGGIGLRLYRIGYATRYICTRLLLPSAILSAFLSSDTCS